jgi:hypothetical protein
LSFSTPQLLKAIRFKQVTRIFKTLTDIENSQLVLRSELSGLQQYFVT